VFQTVVRKESLGREKSALGGKAAVWESRHRLEGLVELSGDLLVCAAAWPSPHASALDR